LSPPRNEIHKRSVVIAGRKTSVSLEDPFWRTFKGIAGRRRTTISELVTSVDAEDGGRSNLSSAIRLFVLEYYRAQLSEYEQLDALRGGSARSRLPEGK
jgi:predicted DNA-binding ribbon-helix-helix protein